ncbi:hypothetical protein LSH36_2870g00000 [Paralvinella palmiformis]|uniref:Apple domain-containing protein n=1 Tax=Paralvinella palmiformis TaxID=53620 RepID=A0AAD9IP49_9ANNE|nr:hypothetical protein LSH36_2870g00000 [Paralvinella palmiformis]
MDYLNVLVYILVVSYVSQRAEFTNVDRCRRQMFYKVTNESYPSEFLVQEGPWPLHKCRRLCRQYLECLTFSVKWVDDKLGMCIIYRGLIEYHALVHNNNTTTYSK